MKNLHVKSFVACLTIFSIFDGCKRVKELENVLLKDETLRAFAINPFVYIFQKEKIPIEIKEVKWICMCQSTLCFSNCHKCI